MQLPRLFPTVTLAAAALLCAAPSHSQSVNPRGASEKVSFGTVSILAAPAGSIGGSTQGEPEIGSILAAAGSAYVVTGIGQASGDAVEVIIEFVSGAGKASVKVAKSAFGKLGVSVGTAVNVARESTGTALVASGKVLAFIPN